MRRALCIAGLTLFAAGCLDGGRRPHAGDAGFGEPDADAGSDATAACIGAPDGTSCGVLRVCRAGSCVVAGDAGEAPVCGDGVAQGDEQCDEPTAACTSACRWTCTVDDDCSTGEMCSVAVDCVQHLCVAREGPGCDAAQSDYYQRFAGSVASDSAGCGTQCLSVAGDEQRDCVTQCLLEAHPDLCAGGCVECLTERIACRSENDCLGACLGQDSSPACIQCLCSAGCLADFDACAGTDTAADCG